jgi:ferrochelatase
MNPSKHKNFTLVNLGGPRTSSEIEVFLRDLFLDPFIFDLPLWEPIRKMLARYIARKRAPKVKETYASMGYGGGSPLVSETERQANAISLILQKKTSIMWSGSVSMACGFPNLRDHLTKENFPSSESIHVPLYPQFSRSTVLSTASIYESITGVCPIGNPGWVDPFGLDTKFIQITADFILEYFYGLLDEAQFPHYKSEGKIKNWDRLDLVFSAHGIPMRLIEKGDVYSNQIEQTVKEITSRLVGAGFNGNVHIAYQSRIGRAKWTEPNTKETLRKLGAKGCDVAIYPISFVSDHLETLEEIGVELRGLAMSAGASSYHRIPAFGTYPKFMEYLSELIIGACNDKQGDECLCQKMGGERLTGCQFK